LPVTDTVRRVPLRRGLDLQGGMHLTMEIDESKGTVQNKSDALDRAITVVRNRIDELGVAEPTVQKAGEDRIFVELPGVDDPDRAEDVLGKAAFLEFQITDKTQALERALPRLDAIAVQRLGGGAAVTPGAGQTASAAPAAGTGAIGGLFAPTDTGGEPTAHARRQAAAIAGQSPRRAATPRVRPTRQLGPARAPARSRRPFSRARSRVSTT
jgi:preprotein translocase subunit SecD